MPLPASIDTTALLLQEQLQFRYEVRSMYLSDVHNVCIKHRGLSGECLGYDRVKSGKC